MNHITYDTYFFFFFKQKTAYELRISDWSSDVCSSDLVERVLAEVGLAGHADQEAGTLSYGDVALLEIGIALATDPKLLLLDEPVCGMSPKETEQTVGKIRERSEEHTSELQSLMRISYAVLCLKKKRKNNKKSTN